MPRARILPSAPAGRPLTAAISAGRPLSRLRAGGAPAPQSLYFPFPYSHPPGWPRACPLQVHLLLRIAPLGGDRKPAPTPRLRARPPKGHAAGYACGVFTSSSVFSSGCSGSPNPVRPSLSAPDPRRHQHGCMPWRTLDQLDGLGTACDCLAVSLQPVEDDSHVHMIKRPISASLTAFR